MPDRNNGRSIADMTDLERHADEIVESFNCFRISGDYADVRKHLWIDTKSFLIRRTEHEHPFEGFQVVTVTTYDPVVDIELSQEELAFDPPS